MDIHILQSLLILIGFSTVIVFLLNRIKLPPILGFLITGVIIGPLGLKLIGSGEEIESISEIGVILLLFVIGLEMSIKQLAQIKKTVFIGGLIEVGLTILLTALIYHLFGVTWSEAVFMGFLFSLSSTAIVLSILQDRNEISQPHGRSALGILIFQDIIVVPMMLVTPIMAGNTSNISYSILALLFKSALVLALTYLLARYVVPKLMYYIRQNPKPGAFFTHYHYHLLYHGLCDRQSRAFPCLRRISSRTNHFRIGIQLSIHQHDSPV